MTRKDYVAIAKALKYVRDCQIEPGAVLATTDAACAALALVKGE